ncbi:MAG TPA: DUF445 domain-containing protein [Xanthomonadales bacterium]|nr:DUF445 domain-containing protein [Xanthomonadales bacterium]
MERPADRQAEVLNLTFGTSTPISPSETQSLPVDEASRLRRMKRWPLLLLLAMAAVFLLTLNRPEAWAGWVHAFAEAGMVGALADWFAVVALFRHPLGLPIPHTAIIPRRKDEIGHSLARFVAEHFLHPDVVRAKLERSDLSLHIINWLKSDAGSQRLVDGTLRFLRWGTGAWREENVRSFLKRLSVQQLQRAELGPLLSRLLEWLVRDGRHQELLTQALRYAVVVLHDHRAAIRGNVQKESPWWLPGFVDDRIVQQMLDRIENLLFQMALDPDHAMRSEFDQLLNGWVEELRTSPSLQQRLEQFKQEAMDNAALQDYLYQVWTDLVAGVERDIASEDSIIAAELHRVVGDFAHNLENDAEMQASINRWLADSAVVLVAENRHSIASLISDTVTGWDAEETTQRVELAIGSDLQYIRINGTLVGGLVGLLLHALGQTL